jgi:sporulation protein YtfJ
MQTQINDIVESAIANLTKAAEVNSIVGKPIIAMDGTTILPISQITFAFMAGGGEYGNKNLTKSFARNNIDGNFAGGSGGGATMKPIGFLVIGEDGVDMVTVEADSTFDKIIDIAKSFTKK